VKVYWSLILALAILAGLGGILIGGETLDSKTSTLAFLNLFGKQEEWKTADEMKGLVDDETLKVMQCYAVRNTKEVTENKTLLFTKVQLQKRIEPTFMLKDNTIYVKNRETILTGGLVGRLYSISLPWSGASTANFFEARCLMKVNETHYRLSVVFYDPIYLKKTLVVSAETPKDYTHTYDGFKEEDHTCKLLRLDFGGKKPAVENPQIPCHHVNYYWIRPNPLTVGFEKEFEKLIDKEKLPKNAAIPIVTRFMDTLVDYPVGNSSGKILVYDPATKSFSEIPKPVRKVYYPEEIIWESMLVGRGYCGVYVSVIQLILRYLGLDVYDGGVNITGAHAVLGVSEKDIAGVKGLLGYPAVAVIQKDDGQVMRIHVLDVTDTDKPYYRWDLHETKYIVFSQYNPI
jgi:hypothetical protein